MGTLKIIHCLWFSNINHPAAVSPMETQVAGRRDFDALALHRQTQGRWANLRNGREPQPVTAQKRQHCSELAKSQAFVKWSTNWQSLKLVVFLLKHEESLNWPRKNGWNMRMGTFPRPLMNPLMMPCKPSFPAPEVSINGLFFSLITTFKIFKRAP